MARPLVKKVVQQRIKENKAIMKAAKKTLTDNMAATTKGLVIDAAETRKALASFMLAAKAVNADNVKLKDAAGDDYNLAA